MLEGRRRQSTARLGRSRSAAETERSAVCCWGTCSRFKHEAREMHVKTESVSLQRRDGSLAKQRVARWDLHGQHSRSLRIRKRLSSSERPL